MSKKATAQKAPVVEPEEPKEPQVQKPASTLSVNWTTVLSWGVTLLFVAALILVLLKINPFKKESEVVENTDSDPVEIIPLPNLAAGIPVNTLFRLANIDTSVPEGVRQFPIKYTVVEGDSIFAIGKKFDIDPETILWANYDYLYDDPTTPLVPGWRLTIPPTDGVYYKWKEGDTLEKIAEKYSTWYYTVDVEDIITWPGNGLDITNPVTDNLVDKRVMIPGGNQVVSWIVPVEFAPRSGATKAIAGPGGCVTPESGTLGSGYFSWPVGQHYLSGFDFSGSHLGIDIAAGVGTPVVASDGGTVVYAGWNDSGYGNLVAIDHNNGYKTIYAHLSTIYVTCGQNINGGTMIGLSGSTGKSTGGHLHFEIRYFSQYVNPWQVLP